MSSLPDEGHPITPTPWTPSREVQADIVIDYDSLVTEDHKPRENLFVEKLDRLLTEPLYSSWVGPGDRRHFLVLVNVGWFYQCKTPAVVPDCMLSLDVPYPPDLHAKEGHSYYQWDMGKQPDLVIETVSDQTGGEESFKKNLYARLGVPYYAIFDPKHLLSAETLRTFVLVGKIYDLTDPGPWADIGLGLRLWRGEFERHEDLWLRWCDANGEIIPTGEELALKMEERRSQAEEQRRQAEERARQAEERTRLLEEELRRLKGESPVR